jgi:carbonic anhydrase
MKKLIQGVVEFRKTKRDQVLPNFEQLALGQRPDVLLLTCSDSRVAVNVFASTDPGDMFVVRNVGNIIPPYSYRAQSNGTGSAIEFALETIGVKHILVCGHSECGAMIGIWNGINNVKGEQLKEWLRYGAKMYPAIRDYNELSRRNVLQQIENLKTYPEIASRVEAGVLNLHGWWFDIKNAEVSMYSHKLGAFQVLDEESAKELMDSF